MKTTNLILLVTLTCCSLYGAKSSPSNPFVDGRFAWNESKPLIKPLNRPDDICYSVKDPTVVHYNGLWHVFCTIRGKKRSHRIEQISFDNWNQTDKAERHILNLTKGYFCAPEVFFFSPRKKWYMIYQVIDKTRKPSLQPAYSTTSNLSDPGSWSKPGLIFSRQPGNVKMWIDFWVICDDKKAYIFFTSHSGLMWRSETTLTNFPRKWSSPEVVLRGDIFEASHTYKLKGLNKYLTIVEARENGKRYYKAFTATGLAGKWKPLAASRTRPFASPINISKTGPHWTTSISHGELLRSGYDEKLEVDPDNLRFLFQGVSSSTYRYKSYGEIPWKLGILSAADIRK